MSITPITIPSNCPIEAFITKIFPHVTTAVIAIAALLTHANVTTAVATNTAGTADPTVSGVVSREMKLQARTLKREAKMEAKAEKKQAKADAKLARGGAWF